MRIASCVALTVAAHLGCASLPTLLSAQSSEDGWSNWQLINGSGVGVNGGVDITFKEGKFVYQGGHSIWFGFRNRYPERVGVKVEFTLAGVPGLPTTTEIAELGPGEVQRANGKEEIAQAITSFRLVEIDLGGFDHPTLVVRNGQVVAPRSTTTAPGASPPGSGNMGGGAYPDGLKPLPPLPKFYLTPEHGAGGVRGDATTPGAAQPEQLAATSAESQSSSTSTSVAASAAAQRRAAADQRASEQRAAQAQAAADRLATEQRRLTQSATLAQSRTQAQTETVNAVADGLRALVTSTLAQRASERARARSQELRDDEQQGIDLLQSLDMSTPSGRADARSRLQQRVADLKSDMHITQVAFGQSGGSDTDRAELAAKSTEVAELSTIIAGIPDDASEAETAERARLASAASNASAGDALAALPDAFRGMFNAVSINSFGGVEYRTTYRITEWQRAGCAVKYTIEGTKPGDPTTRESYAFDLRNVNYDIPFEVHDDKERHAFSYIGWTMRPGTRLSTTDLVTGKVGSDSASFNIVGASPAAAAAQLHDVMARAAKSCASDVAWAGGLVAEQRRLTTQGRT